MNLLLNQDKIDFIADSISNTLNNDFIIENATTVSGGDIHQSFLISNTDNQSFFVKVNEAIHFDLLKTESNSLEKIKNTNSIKVPNVITLNHNKIFSFLVLEALNLKHRGNHYALGQQLASLHKNTHKQFGFDHNNFIGYTPQKSQFCISWPEFWINNRLKPQLQLAYKNGFNSTLQSYEDTLFKACSQQLAHEPVASLLHGDLWSGNKGFLEDGTPVIFDPASYYGDRETDIAMTELFGGFNADFYRGYNDSWPLTENYQQRKNIYNLYHQLNHLNLFGGGYLSACQQAIETIIKHG
jgi:fructosamine-3-kinase